MVAEIRADDLAAHIKKNGLAPLYLIYGEEPLLIMEARDLVRAQGGFAEAEHLFIDAAENAADAARTLAPLTEGGEQSLFAGRRLLDIVLVRPPSERAREALVKFCMTPPPDDITAVSLFDGEVARAAKARAAKPAEWFGKIAAKAQRVYAPAVFANRFSGWIIKRARARGLRLREDAADLLADLTEGNLFAAHQEIVKLADVFQDGEAGADDIKRAVLDAGRFSVFELCAALRERDAARFYRVLGGIGDDQTIPLIGALAYEARELIRSVQGKPPEKNARAAVEARRRVARRFSARDLFDFISALARADRAAKGLESDDPRVEISRAAARLFN